MTCTELVRPRRTAPAAANRPPDRVSQRSPRARFAVLALAVLILAAVVMLSVLVGPRPLALQDVWSALMDPSAPQHAVVRQMRVPRTILGLLAGAALGVAGLVMQAVTRIPLTDAGARHHTATVGAPGDGRLRGNRARRAGRPGDPPVGAPTQPEARAGPARWRLPGLVAGSTDDRKDPMNGTRLSAHDLTLAYERRTVAQNLSVDVPDGSFTVIVGPNACGRSTLLRALSRTLGLLPRSPVAPDTITVRELVGRGRYPHQGLLRQWSNEDERAVGEAMRDTGTEPLADRLVDELSGGRRQRVWIATALARQTPLPLLDDPETGTPLVVPAARRRPAPAP